MKLIITDLGDPSTGIFSATYSVEAPFDESDDSELLEEFKSEAIALYAQYSHGFVVAEYDFVMKGMADEHIKNFPPE